MSTARFFYVPNLKRKKVVFTFIINLRWYSIKRRFPIFIVISIVLFECVFLLSFLVLNSYVTKKKSISLNESYKIRSCWYLVTDWVCILETRVLGFGNAVEKNGFIRKLFFDILPRNNQVCKKVRKTWFDLPKTHFSADFGDTRTVTIYGGCYIFFCKFYRWKVYKSKVGNGRRIRIYI